MQGFQRHYVTLISFVVCGLFITEASYRSAEAFCGFYVAKADATLYNKASQVVIARHDNKTVISMMNDYRGNPRQFAMVIPVPVLLKRGQIHVGQKKLFERIDAFTAPRLVEYFDRDPCDEVRMYQLKGRGGAELAAAAAKKKNRSSTGVKVEARYAVGEYDIVILSAKFSMGLELWLRRNGYQIPQGAQRVLRPYIAQQMKFFVAKVNLKRHAKSGRSYLRPLQFAFDSRKFMLPIRLGMLNASGPQELIVYALTKDGRVETTNYRTVKLPTGVEIPAYVKNRFASFYKAMFHRQHKKERGRVVFVEHFWDMGWCDPCAADPLTPAELRSLGVFWLDDEHRPNPGIQPRFRRRFNRAVNVKVTRLHLRYTKQTFPDDLMFQETSDRVNFQARYVLRHPRKGKTRCEAARRYRQNLPEKLGRQAENLARLTGWDIQTIRRRMRLRPTANPKKNDAWWKKLWSRVSL